MNERSQFCSWSLSRQTRIHSRLYSSFGSLASEELTVTSLTIPMEKFVSVSGNRLATKTKGTGMSQMNIAIPDSADQAADRVMELVMAARLGTLEKMSDDLFKLLWPAVAYLYPGLHPDEASNHGSEVCTACAEDHPVLRRYPELGAPYYTQSGWPITLAPVLEEAWNRYEQQRLDDDEMYCTAAQRASFNLVDIDQISTPDTIH